MSRSHQPERQSLGFPSTFAVVYSQGPHGDPNLSQNKKRQKGRAFAMWPSFQKLFHTFCTQLLTEQSAGLVINIHHLPTLCRALVLILETTMKTPVLVWLTFWSSGGSWRHRAAERSSVWGPGWAVRTPAPASHGGTHTTRNGGDKAGDLRRPRFVWSPTTCVRGLYPATRGNHLQTLICTFKPTTKETSLSGHCCQRPRSTNPEAPPAYSPGSKPLVGTGNP